MDWCKIAAVERVFLNNNYLKEEKLQCQSPKSRIRKPFYRVYTYIYVIVIIEELVATAATMILEH